MRYSRPMSYTVADSVCQSNPCNAIGGKCMVTDDGTTNNSPMFYCECNAGYVGYLCEGEYNLLFALITDMCVQYVDVYFLIIIIIIYIFLSATYNAIQSAIQ